MGDDASSLADSESRSCGASGSSMVGGAVEGGVLDATEGSSLGLPEEDLQESDLSIGKEECKSLLK